MRTIASSGTLRDRRFHTPAHEVLFGITVQSWGRHADLARVDYVIRTDGREISNGRYDLRDSVSGEFFHLRKFPLGWEVVVGSTIVLNA